MLWWIVIIALLCALLHLCDKYVEDKIQENKERLKNK